MTTHRMRWYIYVFGPEGKERIPHTASMRGHWPAWDAVCSCGWESRTGGATRRSVEQDVYIHKLLAKYDDQEIEGNLQTDLHTSSQPDSLEP